MSANIFPIGRDQVPVSHAEEDATSQLADLTKSATTTPSSGSRTDLRVSCDKFSRQPLCPKTCRTLAQTIYTSFETRCYIKHHSRDLLSHIICCQFHNVHSILRRMCGLTQKGRKDWMIGSTWSVLKHILRCVDSCHFQMNRE